MNTNRIRYNYEFLQDFCKENNIGLLHDYSNINILRDSIIEGNCNTIGCSNVFKKKFRQLCVSNGFCDNCTSQNRKNKVKETCIKKFGTDCTFKSKEIRDKGKETIIQKYGVENISQNEDIKKIKKQTIIQVFGEKGLKNPIIQERKSATSLKHFGVEFPTQSQEVQEK